MRKAGEGNAGTKNAVFIRSAVGAANPAPSMVRTSAWKLA
jgi:hypothetical protein